jgi:hypothetical protein
MTERGFKRVTNNGVWYEGIGLKDLGSREASGDY